MTPQDVAAAISAAGHFPDFLEIDPLSDELVVDTARTRSPTGARLAPLIRAFKDRKGRWVLTVFGEEYCHVPNADDVPAAAIAMLREMDRRMLFSPQVIRQYNLVELNPAEFATADE